jgi:HEPN domain-containing protein
LDSYREPTEHAKVNYFGIRCFRDTGDLDYIAARLAMRSGLAAPFLWSASQAVEKYLKCILFLNRINTKDLSHNLKAALDRVNDQLPFAIELNSREQKVFKHLARWNSDRYLLTSFELENGELFQLDELVWKLRLFCRPLNKRHYADEPSGDVLRERVAELAEIIKGSDKLAGHLEGAVLENIILKPEHPAHGGLVWKNMFYSRTKRVSIRYRDGFQAVNAPLFLNPELADVVGKWMKISPAVLEGAKRLARQRSSRRKT